MSQVALQTLPTPAEMREAQKFGNSTQNVSVQLIIRFINEKLREVMGTDRVEPYLSIDLSQFNPNQTMLFEIVNVLEKTGYTVDFGYPNYGAASEMTKRHLAVLGYVMNLHHNKPEGEICQVLTVNWAEKLDQSF